MTGYQLDGERRLMHAMGRHEAAEKLAAERLKGLQSQERQIKELKQELARERDINDAMVEANRAGRQSLIKFKQRVTLALEQVVELQGQIGELQTENATLKDTIDCQDEDLAALRRELQEAKRKLLQRMRDDVEEAIKALRDEPRRFWDADVFNFADELISRLKGE